MKQFVILLAGLTILSCNAAPAVSEGGQAMAQEQPKSQPQALKSAQAQALIEKRNDLVILDVRTPAEFAGGHLKHAQLLNKYDPAFETKLKALDRNKTYLVYCAVGGRSGQAAQLMQQFGFKHVYDATEGYNHLKAAGVAVEK